MKQLSRAELVRWHESTLDTAKKILLEQNRLYPVAFILARQMELDPYVRSKALELTTWQPLDLSGDNPAAYVVLSFALSYTDAAELLGYITFLAPDPVQMEHDLHHAVAVGKGVVGSARKARQMVVDTFLRSQNCDGKDLASSFLRKMCHSVDAEAIVKVDEAWMARTTAPKGGVIADIRGGLAKNLEDEPTSIEVIMTNLETREGMRGVMLPFNRTQRNSGQVTGFGAPVIHEDGLTGRFTDFLPGAAERRKARGQ